MKEIFGVFAAGALMVGRLTPLPGVKRWLTALSV